MGTSKSIIVFSTPTCSWCRKLKSYLKEKNLRFKDIDVSKNEQAARDMVKKTGQRGVPQVWINNRPVVGFNKTELERLLNKK